jgi:methyl-accepting chemotaxis protein
MDLRNIKIGPRLGIAFGVIALLTVLLGAVTYARLDHLGQQWDGFRANNLAKAHAVRSGRVALGDGIHQFKNYILRGRDYDVRFNEQMNRLDSAMHKYQQAGKLNDEERSLVRQVNDATNAYRDAMRQAVEKKSAGAPIEQIDSSIQGADKSLNAALDKLDGITDAENDAVSASLTRDIANGKGLAVAACVGVLALTCLLAWSVTRSITRPITHAAHTAKVIATGDLTQEIEAAGTDEAGELLAALRDMNASLVALVARVRDSTETIGVSSAEIAAGTQDLSQRTEQTAASLEETASSMEELTVTVRHNAENAREANRLASSASEIAARGGKVMSEVVQTMAEIRAASNRIVDIIGVIDGIAFQTNILALNAAVEAARAGDQGRGFAVVAAEVRSLAQRSATAAKQIKVLIGDSVEKVESGTRLVDVAGTTINEVVGSIDRVTGIMNEIDSASGEQTVGIEQVNQAVVIMDKTTQQNAALVEQAAAAAEAMRDQAVSLTQAVAVFQLGAAASRGRRVALT